MNVKSTHTDVNYTPRALIVDDSESMLRVVDLFMTHMGFQTEKALDGQQALETFLRLRMSRAFDIIVSGIYMPVMRGTELGIAIRKVDTSIPMLAMCGYCGFDPQEALGQATGGFDGFLRKPFTLCEFQQAVLAVAMKRNADRILNYADFYTLWTGPMKESNGSPK